MVLSLDEMVEIEVSCKLDILLDRKTKIGGSSMFGTEQVGGKYALKDEYDEYRKSSKKKIISCCEIS